MAELATTDGRPPPTVPTGEVTCTRLVDGSIRIDAADPRILISGELLDAIAQDSAIVDGTEAFARNAWLIEPVPHQGSFVGAVLHIHGVNRQVIYRITDYMPRIHGYVAEWPD